MLFEDFLFPLDLIHSVNQVIVRLYLFLKLLKSVLCQLTRSKHPQ